MQQFMEQLQHEPWYERETVEAPARCPECDEPYATEDHECDCGDPICSLCEIRESEHSEPFPCRWYPQD